MRANPTSQILSPGSFGKSVTAISQSGDENGSRVHLASFAVVNQNGGAGVVDEQLLAGGVLLPECAAL